MYPSRLMKIFRESEEVQLQFLESRVLGVAEETEKDQAK